MKNTLQNIPLWFWLLCIFAFSLPIKLAAAQNMQWDIDFIPVVSRIETWLRGGAFPAYGTLSSVAAYNMPALQWLHIPAYALTRNAGLSILITMLTFNLLSTWAIFALGKRMFNWRVGLIAATLFTFSDSGISSSYTAWAQQLLPGFYALILLCLWQWYEQKNGLYLALSGIIATFATMAHFSAIILFPAMLIFALLSRAKWQWRYLLGGAVAALLLLAPYISFQIERDFVDLKAFLSKDVLVDADLMRELRYLKPEGGKLPLDYRYPPIEQEQAVTNAAQVVTVNNVEPPQASQTSTALVPRWQRAITFGFSIPAQTIKGLNLAFKRDFAGLGALSPLLETLAHAMMWIMACLFWLATIRIIGRWFAQGRAIFTQAAPPDALLLMVILTVVGMLIITRNIDQPTYFMGLQSLQLLVIATLIDSDRLPRFFISIAIGFVLLYVGLHITERSARLLQHNDEAFTAFNVGLYRHVDAAAGLIADDWASSDPVTVSYDILPEMRSFWWVVAWHSIDEGYRMGMNFDYLLETHYGLHNTNASAFGLADNPNYIIVYGESGLSRYDLADYELLREGAIFILKPKE